MEKQKPVERLFPFARKARILIPGRTLLERSKSRLQFILITEDLTGNSRKEILADFHYYPIVQRFHRTDLDRFFDLKNTGVLGFSKSDLSKSIYLELKEFRINRPIESRSDADSRGSASTGGSDHGDAGLLDD